MYTHNEKKGTLLAFLSAALWGLFPVMVNRGSHSVPPLLFAALSALLAAFVSLLYLVLRKSLGELRTKDAYASLLMVTLCIVIIPYTLLFLGASRTSGLNTSLLLLSEIIFTLLFTPLVGEKTTFVKLAGSLGVLAGAAFILYDGRRYLNTGDVMVILSTATYPIGNFYAKKAMNRVSASTILFVRFFLGGLFLLSVSAVAEPSVDFRGLLAANWFLLIFTGVILLGAGKILWYEALKRLDISKAISISMTFPLFSLLALVSVFHQPVNVRQGIGVALMMIGVLFSVKRQSVDPASTRYAP
jgi:drug/metabolite transporter (DMT)-like permease